MWCTMCGPLFTIVLTLVIVQSAHSTYLCDVEKELPFETLCDGVKHCEDGLDELPETCLKIVCPDDTYRCRYGACVKKSTRCNGNPDCADNSDEHFCNASVICERDEFQCLNGKCLRPKDKCDGHDHCGDGSDEHPTLCRNIRCNQNKFKCKSGECINKNLICDGYPDCYDGSDETKSMCKRDKCYDGNCNSGQVTCPPIQSNRLRVLCNIPGQGEISCEQEQAIGTMAHMQCKEYYDPIGSESQRTAVCQHDGRWNSDMLQCRPKCGITDPVQPLIANGNMMENWPWHAVMYLVENGNLTFFCGGTLISEYIVITAAHCIWKKTPEQITVAFGKYITDFDVKEDHSQIRNLSKIIMQPNYHDFETNYGSDIAVLFLENPVILNGFIRPACIDWDIKNIDLYLKPQSLGIVAGMGITETDTFSHNLKSTSAPIVSVEQCINNQGKDFRKYITYTTFCAGWANGTGVCNGDSGGGLLVNGRDGRWILQGIVSVSPRRKGLAICDTKRFAIFTKLGLYLNWLKQVITPTLLGFL